MAAEQVRPRFGPPRESPTWAGGGMNSALRKNLTCAHSQWVYDRKVTRKEKWPQGRDLLVACCIHIDTAGPMWPNMESLRQQRDLVLQQIQAIDRLRRGS